MDPLTIAALGSLAISAGGTAFGAIQAEKASRRAQQMQKEQFSFADKQALIAYQRQQELINQANLYNSPVKQMERYEAAGLNPHLMYQSGSGAIAASTATAQQASSPSPASPTDYYAGLAGQMNGFASSMMDMIRLENESKVAESVAAKNYADAGLTTSNRELLNKTMDFKVTFESLNNLMIEQNISESKSRQVLNSIQSHLGIKQGQLIDEQKLNAIEQRTYQTILNKYVDQRQALEISKLLADIHTARITADYTEMQAKFVEFNAKTQRISADASMAAARKMGFEQFLVNILQRIFFTENPSSEDPSTNTLLGRRQLPKFKAPEVILPPVSPKHYNQIRNVSDGGLSPTNLKNLMQYRFPTTSKINKR